MAKLDVLQDASTLLATELEHHLSVCVCGGGLFMINGYSLHSWKAYICIIMPAQGLCPAKLF